MLKRLTAFLFVLMIAGNVFAGVCGCIGDADHQDPCCKRELNAKDSFSAKPCCDDNCVTSGSVSTPRTQGESTVKIPIPADEIAVVAIRNFAFDLSTVRRSEITVPFVDKRLIFPRPPDLYLKHHSFLI